MKLNKSFLLGLIFIIGIWIIGSTLINNDIILPRIDNVLSALISLLKKLETYTIISSTLSRLVITIIVSLLMAILLASISIVSKNFQKFIAPLIILIKTMPVVSIIIILIIMIGHNQSPFFITGFVIFPVMYEGILLGMKSIDKNINDEILLISKVNFPVIKDIYLPMITPYIITSLIQSLGLGFKVMVMAEFISQPKNSIGKVLLAEKEFLRMDNIMAWTIIIIFIVIILEMLVKIFKNHSL